MFPVNFEGFNHQYYPSKSYVFMCSMRVQVWMSCTIAKSMANSYGSVWAHPKPEKDSKTHKKYEFCQDVSDYRIGSVVLFWSSALLATGF